MSKASVASFPLGIELSSSDSDLDLSSLPSVPSTSALLNHNLSLHPRAFHCVHVNAQLPAHADDFCFIFSGNVAHCIGVSETWLQPSLHDSMVALPEYRLHRVDRVGKRGGGVARYVKEHLKSRVVFYNAGAVRPSPEMLFVSVCVGKLKVLVCTIYIPPKVTTLSDVHDALTTHLPDYDYAVVMGDLNCNLMTDGVMHYYYFTLTGL